MSLPIKPTPVLRSKDAERFLKKIIEELNFPSYLCGDPKRLETARRRAIKNLSERFRTDDQP